MGDINKEKLIEFLDLKVKEALDSLQGCCGRSGKRCYMCAFSVGEIHIANEVKDAIGLGGLGE